MTMTITSPAFVANGEIPAAYTCDGNDISPALVWNGVPTEAKSLVLIMDDPDAPDPAAPKMIWTHWVLYNIPVDTMGLEEAVSSSQLPKGILEGQNDWHQTGYRGPCPPIGRHRYFIKLYALDTELADLNKPTKAKIEQAITGHVISEAQIMGTYQH